MEKPGTPAARAKPQRELKYLFQNSLAASAPKRIAMLLRRPHPASASF
jgi:hypothetical protein